MLKAMVEESNLSTDKKPSPELFEMIQAAANNLMSFGGLWNSIKKKGHDEGFSERELEDMLRPLLKPQLNKDQIYYLFHTEEKKEQSRQSYHRNIPTVFPKKNQEQNKGNNEPPEKPPEIPPPPEEPPTEDPKDIEIQFLKEQVAELQDALKKTEQFKPATELQEQPAAKDPTPELQLTDDLVFQYLRDRAKETGNILIIDRVGAGALVQALSQYKNSFGVAELFLRVIK